MKRNAVYLKDLHFEHGVWLKELVFFTEELAIFQKRLEEVAARNTAMEILSKVESFQNRFIRQAEVMQELKHDINEHEEILAHYAQEHPIAIDHVHFHDHTSLRERVDTFRDLFVEMKREFLRFCAEWI